MSLSSANIGQSHSRQRHTGLPLVFEDLPHDRIDQCIEQKQGGDVTLLDTRMDEKLVELLRGSQEDDDHTLDNGFAPPSAGG